MTLLPIGLTDEEVGLLCAGLRLAMIHGDDGDFRKYNRLMQKLRTISAGYRLSQSRLSNDLATFQNLGGTVNGVPVGPAAMKRCECEGVIYTDEELLAGVHTTCGGLIS